MEIGYLAAHAAADERAKHAGAEVYWHELAVIAAREALLERLRDQNDLFPPEPDRPWFSHASRDKECFVLDEASLTLVHASHTLDWSGREWSSNLVRACTHPVEIALSRALSSVASDPGTQATTSNPT